MKKKWRIFLIAVALITILVITWWYVSQPHYETLLYGKIKLIRSDGTPSRWFFYEFEISQETELTIKIKQGLPNGHYAELLWYLCNSTKENIENATHWFKLVYAYGDALRTLDKTIVINKADTYTFILILPSFSSYETVPTELELSLKTL